MVKTLPSSEGGVGSIPGQGAEIPQASVLKIQNRNNRHSIVTSSVRTLKWSTPKNKNL